MQDFEPSRTAIVHDYLGQAGGAERVVLQLAAMFPGAPIYTSFYEPEHTYPQFEELDVRPSSLQGHISPERFRMAAPLYPSAFRSFDLSAFDQVVVSTSAFAHHVRHPRSFVYCHTPPRFLYDPGAYQSRTTRTLAPVLRRAQGFDRRAANHHASYAANSRTTAARIAEAYGLDAEVIYPPLWTGHLPSSVSPFPSSPQALVVARLLPYKRVDVAVAACAEAGVPLVVAGEGPDLERLRRLDNGGTTFLGRVGDDELGDLFASSSLVLAPGLEDFGYAPVEANYAGRPVVAQAAGGALESVRDGLTGRLVAGDDVHRWATTIGEVLDTRWDPGALRAATAPFSCDQFRRAVRTWARLPETQWAALTASGV